MISLAHFFAFHMHVFKTTYTIRYSGCNKNSAPHTHPNLKYPYCASPPPPLRPPEPKNPYPPTPQPFRVPNPSLN